MVKSIALDATKAAENIVEAGGKIFVQQAAYGDGKDIAIINTSKNEIEKTITLSENIKNTISANGYIYVLSSDANSTKVSTISPAKNEVISTNTYAVGKGSKIRIDQGKLFFSAGTNIYKVDLANAPEAKLFLELKDLKKYSSLYGFDVIDGKIFTSEANGFTEASDITVYSATDGKLLQSFKAGIGTNAFYLNK